MVERPSEVTEILELLKQGNKVGVVGRHGGDVGIRGMGGLGKTVLAQAVAWEVSKSRQVVWLDIGQTPDRLKLINTLVRVLGGDVSFSDIVAAESWLRKYTVCCDRAIFKV
jgi:Holliday junction resolvasome RuvABC ATP-dependent DNA helicase subunit